MERASSHRQRVLAAVAGQIVGLSTAHVAKVAIDGVDGAGKTMFADGLAALVRAGGRPVIRASVDGFHNPKAVRYRRGRSSPEGFYLDSYDYPALKQTLLDPLRPSGSGRYRVAVFDHVTDMPVAAPEQIATPGSVLLFDGIFLHRPELCGQWDASIFLQVDVEVSVARCAQRDGSSPDPGADANRRYVEGQRLYLTQCNPAQRATMTIDYNDLSAPFFIRLASRPA